MKLISYKHDNQASFGIVKDDKIIDLTIAFDGRFNDLKSLLAANAMNEALAAFETYEPHFSLDDVELLPPIPNPGTIWCVGVNTHTHFHEVKEHMGLDALPSKPILFIRSAQTLVASDQALEKPTLEPAFDFEGEIALVIGQKARNLSVEQAMEAVAGFSCFNDASARAYQMHSSQVTAGKNAYRSGGFGPCLATPDEIDFTSMKMVCRVNGVGMQSMLLDDLIFSFAEIVSYISEFTVLEPGDVIVTGSPEGIGVLRTPSVLLQSGDEVEVEVSGVGVLRNTVLDQQ